MNANLGISHRLDWVGVHQQLGGRKRVKLGHNTWLESRIGDAVAVVYHETDVVTYHRDGRVVLDSGGWQTSTTKRRLCECSPVHVYQHRKQWFVTYEGVDYLYEDGMVIDTNAGNVSTKSKEDAKQEIRKASALRRRINTYSNAFVAAIGEGRVSMPSAGDCFYCQMQTTSGEMLGSAMRDRSHIELHMKEKYFVPSLAFRAAKKFGVSPAALEWLRMRCSGDMSEVGAMGTIGAEQVRKAIESFVSREMGVPS